MNSVEYHGVPDARFGGRQYDLVVNVTRCERRRRGIAVRLADPGKPAAAAARREYGPFLAVRPDGTGLRLGDDPTRGITGLKDVELEVILPRPEVRERHRLLRVARPPPP